MEDGPGFLEYRNLSKKMKKKHKEIISWVVYLTFLGALVYGTPKLLTKVLNTPYPMAVITSGSMWPALKKGDMVLIKGIEGKEDIKTGDIVVYKNEKGFTIHRVVKVDAVTLTTKGDANNSQDSPIRYEELIGKTVAFREKPLRIPFLGSIGIFINKTVKL